jgi:hypothetical protein
MDWKRYLVQGASGTFGIIILNTGLLFLVHVMLARTLGAGEYGVYAYAMSWVGLLCIPSLFGMDQLLIKNVAHISYWESKKDKGVYHAWNKALDHANGEWICFLGADDVFWEKSCLYRMCHYLKDSYPGVRIVYGRVNVVTETGKILYTIGNPWNKLKKKIFKSIACRTLG